MTVCLYKFEYTVAHLCPITACGMTSFGGLLSEQLPCLTQNYLAAIHKRRFICSFFSPTTYNSKTIYLLRNYLATIHNKDLLILFSLSVWLRSIFSSCLDLLKLIFNCKGVKITVGHIFTKPRAKGHIIILKHYIFGGFIYAKLKSA